MAKNTITSWQKLALGTAILEPGNASKLKTGDWRTLIPEYDKEKCIKCGMCAVYCPEFCVSEQEDGFYLPDYFYCKGCGICANMCPKDAITMIVEEK